MPFGRAWPLGRRRMKSHTNRTPPSFLQKGKGPGAYSAWEGLSAYTGFSHPRRKIAELGQEARLKPPPGAPLPAEQLRAGPEREGEQWICPRFGPRTAKGAEFPGGRTERGARTPRICGFYSASETCLLLNGVGWCPANPSPGPATSPKPVGVGGCKEAEARRVHSQTRQSASSQPPVLQFRAALSRILQREAHTFLLQLQAQAHPSASVPHTLGGTEVGRVHTLSPGSSQPGPNSL